MATQAALIAETIAGMKRVISNRQDSSDSDDYVHRPTNRGNKLKRKAQFIHEGQLDLPNGPKTYKSKIEHAGYQRYVLSRNPKRYDEYGDELEHDELDEQADEEAANANPYGDIKLEHLLAPLTSAGDLPDHPSLATAYTSNVLSGMVQQACEMVHKEKKSLWDIKHLLTKFRGDQTWIPVESMISDESPLFSRAPLLEDPVAYLKPKVTNIDHFTADERKTERMPGQAATAVNVGREFGSRQRSNASLGELLPNVHNQRNLENTARLENPDVLMDDGSPHSTEKENPTQNTNGEKSRESHANAQENLQKNVTSTREEMADSNVINNNTKRSDLAASAIESRVLSNGTIPPAESDHEPKDTTATKVETEAGTSALKDLPVAEDNQIEETQPPAHRMRTRAQAQAVSEKTSSSHTRSPSPTSSVPPLIHPLYLVSSSSIPDRDFGLPPAEAEETRRILMSWVQKQEEICRGVEKLYDGLLKADRMRKTVLGWCKAEGHVGEMSDGEDWYDKEEWGLDEDLKKGHEEEEEDAGNQGKKTRGRRAVQ